MKKIYIIYWIVLILGVIIFFLTDGLIKIILGFIIMILPLIGTNLNKYTWANKLLEDLGIAILGGLIVSIFRDISANQWTSNIIVMYFMMFLTAVILLIMGNMNKPK